VLGRPLDALPDEIRKSPAVQKDKAVASVVFRYVDGKAVATPVVVGPSDETHTLIKQGLDDGAEVIAGRYKVLDTLQHDRSSTSRMRLRPRNRRHEADNSTGDRARDRAGDAPRTRRRPRPRPPGLLTSDTDAGQPTPLIIRLINIAKHYRVGDEQIRALDGVWLERRDRTSTSRSWAPAARARAR
jgi:hypothetical protein